MPARTRECIYHARATSQLKAELFRIAGVDLTDVPGISIITAHTILMEVGRTCRGFAMPLPSHLGLGSARKSKSAEVRSSLLGLGEESGRDRAATRSTLPVSRQELPRRVLPEDGAPEAVTATAHRLVRIIYHMLSTREPYSQSVLARCDQQVNIRAETRLRKQAANLGFQLTRVLESEA
jgi:transposase